MRFVSRRRRHLVLELRFVNGSFVFVDEGLGGPICRGTSILIELEHRLELFHMDNLFVGPLDHSADKERSPEQITG